MTSPWSVLYCCGWAFSKAFVPDMSEASYLMDFEKDQANYRWPTSRDELVHDSRFLRFTIPASSIQQKKGTVLERAWRCGFVEHLAGCL